MKSTHRSAVLRYGFAVLIIGVMTLLHVLVGHLGVSSLFAIYVPAVAAAAWFGGWRPALLACVLATVVGVYFFEPLHIGIATLDAQARLLVFWGSSLFVMHIIVSLQSTRQAVSDIKRTAHDARRSHETTLASIADGVIVTDANERITFMNPVAEGLTGWMFPEAMGRALDDVVTLGTRDGESMVTEQPGPYDEQVSVHSTLSARDGTERPVMRSMSPIRDTQGRVSGRVLVLRDATDVRAQGQIDALLRAIVASTSDAIIGVSDDARVTSWNDGARRLYGYGADEILGRDVTLLMPPEYHAAVTSLLESTLRGERVIDHDLVGMSRDGRQFDASVSCAPLRAGVGRGLSLTVRDIGERRSGERRVRQLGAQLVRRAQELQTLFDVAPVAMAIAEDAECRFVRPNLALAELLGVERTANVSFVASPLRKPLPYRVFRNEREMRDEESPLALAVWRRAPIEPIEFDVISPGRRVTVLAHAAPVIDQDDKVVGCIGVFIDITEMKRSHAERARLLAEAIDARKVAEEASRLKEEFLATVSHELRTPLNAIYGWLEIMQRKPDAATQQRGLDIIRRNVRAQTRVIEDILDVSAIITGKSRLDIRPIDLSTIVEAVHESLRPTADAKGLSLGLSIDPDGAPIAGDPDRLQQVLWNLLSNAIKFTPSGGRVMLTLVRDGAQVRAEVEDTGDGIATDFLPYVFDRFRQADSSIGRRHGGLGLGLAIVRHLVELHGGTVGARSDGLGCGATFTVSLPLRIAPDVPLAMVAPASGEAGEPGAGYRPLERRRVLIVEDDPFAAEVLARGLAHAGAQVRAAACADEGLTLVLDWKPDVIVSDIGLPRRDGYAFLKDVRAVQARLGETPVLAIAITAYAREEDRLLAHAAGFDGYLMKPVAPSVVVETIAGFERAAALTDGARAPSDLATDAGMPPAPGRHPPHPEQTAAGRA